MPSVVLNRQSLRSAAVGALPLVLLLLMVLAFLILPGLSGRSVTSFNFYNALQYFAGAGLLALALGITMVAGEFDLSTVGLFGLAGMIAVQTGQGSPLVGVLLALAAAAAIGVVQGVLVAKLRINSMTVTLGGYLSVLGLTAVLGNSKSVPYPDYTVGASLDQSIATFFSQRSLIAIAMFVLVALTMRYTTIGRHVRAIGGDRRASRVVGVRVDRYLIGVFVASAMLSALGGAMLGYSQATAVPDVGLSPLIFGVTATLLGGVTLAGGKGGPLGIAAGALTLALLNELFAVLQTADYVSNLVTGGLLLVVTVISAPDILRWWRRTAPARHQSARTRRSGPTAPAVAGTDLSER